MNICTQCQGEFEVSDFDRAFLEKVSPVFGGKKYLIPDPSLCPICRSQRRLSFRNESHLYKRNCSKSGKPIVSVYPEDAHFPVYHADIWYGDDWDPCEYGQDFDFSRSFFDQFEELQNKVPRLALVAANNVNCDYVNLVGDCKDCYLIYGSIECENCLYGNPYHCKDCVDSLLTRGSQFCYESIDCENLYECRYCQDCSNGSQLHHCFDLEGCKNCFLCAGLRQKQYCILNQVYSKEEYDNKLGEYKSKSTHELEEMLSELKKKTPVKNVIGAQNENVEGDHVFQSKKCNQTFFSERCEEVDYTFQVLDSHHCKDMDYGEEGEFLYEISGFYKCSNSAFSGPFWYGNSDLYYCSICCNNNKHCFGCISLQHKEYCILNKQYSKEEYEELVPKIIEHMKRTPISAKQGGNKEEGVAEWGEFFPVQLSPFAYNETVAQDYFPLTKEEVVAKGWNWKNPEDALQDVQKVIPASRLPDSIEEVPDEVLDWAIQCEESGRPFKITAQELKFYRRHNISLPHFHPNIRHIHRIQKRNPRQLFERKCSKCQKAITSTYSVDRPEEVLCERCYFDEVY
jgi:hypothetical protein